MIWLWLIVLAAVCALALAPVFFGRIDAGEDDEIAEYFAQIDAVAADDSLTDDARLAARTTLERRILARQTATTSPSPVAGVVTLAAIGLLGLGLYAATGTPKLTEPAPANEVDDLIRQLEQRLATDRADDSTGWLIYARTLRSMGREREAQEAFNRAASLSDTPAPIAAERDRAPGPSAEDIEAASEMSADDRQAMIQGMVDGLSQRLADAPPEQAKDPAAWVRLIRSRVTLNQREQARIEVERMRALFADEPEVAAKILTDAGWTDD